jgi:tetratricopeptide (TPR) repeat protein
MGQGKLAEAADLERQVVEALHAQGRRRVEGLAETYLARILLRKGESGAAEEAVRRAVSLLDVAPVSRSMALAVLARTLLAEGKNDEAIGHAREAMNLLRSLGALEEGEALVRLTFAEALVAVGDRAAGAAIAEAKDALTARAKNIDDLKLRQSFLERVEENAATLALIRAGVVVLGGG